MGAKYGDKFVSFSAASNYCKLSRADSSFIEIVYRNYVPYSNINVFVIYSSQGLWADEIFGYFHFLILNMLTLHFF